MKQVNASIDARIVGPERVEAIVRRLSDITTEARSLADDLAEACGELAVETGELRIEP